jgi:hypothetical protein
MLKMTPVEKISAAADKMDAARAALEEAIHEARAESLSLRAIARAARMSHESVRKIAP